MTTDAELTRHARRLHEEWVATRGGSDELTSEQLDLIARATSAVALAAHDEDVVAAQQRDHGHEGHGRQEQRHDE